MWPLCDKKKKKLKKLKSVSFNKNSPWGHKGAWIEKPINPSGSVLVTEKLILWEKAKNQPVAFNAFKLHQRLKSNLSIITTRRLFYFREISTQFKLIPFKLSAKFTQAARGGLRTEIGTTRHVTEWRSMLTFAPCFVRAATAAFE